MQSNHFWCDGGDDRFDPILGVCKMESGFRSTLHRQRKLENQLLIHGTLLLVRRRQKAMKTTAHPFALGLAFFKGNLQLSLR